MIYDLMLIFAGAIISFLPTYYFEDKRYKREQKHKQYDEKERIITSSIEILLKVRFNFLQIFEYRKDFISHSPNLPQDLLLKNYRLAQENLNESLYELGKMNTLLSFKLDKKQLRSFDQIFEYSDVLAKNINGPEISLEELNLKKKEALNFVEESVQELEDAHELITNLYYKD